MPLARLSTAPRPFLSGWTKRKQFTVNATAGLRGRVIEMMIYNTTGTDTDTVVYLDGNVRSDWGDIRITKSDGLTRIPWGIERKHSDHIEIVFLGDLRSGDTKFFLYYDGPAADVYKIASITDQHYDSGTSLNDRDNAVTYLANFNTRMATYLPDLAVSNGDKTGASSSNNATQQGWYQSIMDEFDNVTATVKRDGIAPGNHDFEYMSFANILAKHSAEAWRTDATKLYDYWESTNFRFISLDAYYTPSGNTHTSLDFAAHQGYGYVNPDQMDWLRARLAESTKEVIIFIHQPCCELDTDQWNLTKAIYHTQNRYDFRNIIEQSRKVIAVIHGHTHFSRVDVINGIPYLCTGNLTNDDSEEDGDNFGELPLLTDGRWELFEFDRSSRNINMKREALISASYETIYEYNIPFGRTSIVDDVGNNPEAVFRLGGGGGFGRSAYLRDPTQMIAIESDNIWKFPVNIHTPDTSTFEGSIKLEGRTSSPNFGEAVWHVENNGTRMIFKGWVMMGTQANASIRLIGPGGTATASVVIHFDVNGTLYVYDATSKESIQPYSLNTWYKFEVFVETATQGHSGRINDVNAWGLPTAWGFFSFANKAIRAVEVVTETLDMWIHSFSIRPWFSPRPTMEGFETEETP